MGSIENDTIEEVIQYFNEVLHKDIEKLHPLKGQRIFNPRFHRWISSVSVSIMI